MEEVCERFSARKECTRDRDARDKLGTVVDLWFTAGHLKFYRLENKEKGREEQERYVRSLWEPM